MVPVTQTRVGYPEGNCFMAAIASVLEVSLDDLPDLFDECCEWHEDGRWDHGDWWGVTRGAVRSLGWDIVYIPTKDHKGVPPGYSIAGGPSPRKDVVNGDGKNAGHAVVCLDGRMIHDPHPSGDGLDGNVVDEWYIFLVPPFPPDVPKEPHHG